MTVEELSSLSIPAIEDMNNMLVDRADNDLFRIGALWSEISKREVWKKEWKYELLADAIEARAPRGYSTIMEQIKNYDFFVRDGRMGYATYESQFAKLGHRRMSYLRQRIKGEEEQHPNLVVTQFEKDKHVHRFERTKFVKEELDKIATMSVQEAKSYVLERSKESGVEVDEFIDERYHWTKEQYELIQQEQKWMSKRAGKPLSNQSAIAFALQEHLAQYGTRRIKKD